MSGSKFQAAKAFGVVTLRGEFHTNTFEADRLPGWIAFYERMVEKYGHKSKSYKQALDALRAVA